MMPEKQRILLVSHDPKLAQARKKALESEGFNVLSVLDISTVRGLCRKNKPHLVIIGHSVPPAQKRRIWIEAREHCRVPILELDRNGDPDLLPRAFFRQEGFNEFVEAVKRIVKKKNVL